VCWWKEPFGGLCFVIKMTEVRSCIPVQEREACWRFLVEREEQPGDKNAATLGQEGNGLCCLSLLP
jgi:hypothetical protein